MTQPAINFFASLQRSGTRFLADLNSGFLLIEREDDSLLSPHARENLSTIARVTRDDTVVLINRDDQLEAWLSLEQMARIPIRDFRAIRTIGLSPSLGYRLLRHTPRVRALGQGLCTLAVDDLEFDDAESSLRAALEQRVLRPWVNHFQLLTLPHHGSKHSVWSELQELQNRLKSVTVVLTEATSKVAATTNEEVAIKIQDAATELNDIIEDLPTVTDLEPPAQAAPATDIAPREQSPVDNAIAIRERLLESVPFVDAAKWAKWRGVKSNPSAALGKYKRQGRVFAVRSSKQDLYPKFQFADNALPLPVMKEILAVVPKDAQGWSLLSWFEAKNVLVGERKPAEVLEDEPASVVAAAARFYSRDD